MTNTKTALFIWQKNNIQKVSLIVSRLKNLIKTNTHLRKTFVLFLVVFMVSMQHPATGQSTSGMNLKLELPGYWAHLSYIVTGAEFGAPTGSDRGNVGSRQYIGQLTGNELTVSGTAVSDNESSGPGSGDYYELVVFVTVGKESKKYNYIAPKGEKLSKPFFLSVPIDPGATSGSFTISLLEHNAKWGQYGWVVTGSLSRKPVTKPPQIKPTPPVNVLPEGSRKSAARFSGMHGQVEILRAGAGPDGWKSAELDDVLNVEDRIKTAEDADCILSFADMSTFIMKPKTEIVIIAPPDKDSKIGLVMGNVWVNVKKMVKDGSMEIDLNQAVAGIKGTTFVASTTKTSSTLKVISGLVSFKSKANGKILMVGSGESVTASKTGLSAKTRFDVAAISKEWDNVRNHRNAGVNGKESVVFKLQSLGGVSGNPSSKTVFNLSSPTQITRILTYHWNGGRGATPGTIGLRNVKTGQLLGTWNAMGNNSNPNTPGEPLPKSSGTAPYLYWTALPNITVPAGRYEVVDSDRTTWSTNSEMGNMGLAWVYGKQ